MAQLGKTSPKITNLPAHVTTGSFQSSSHNLLQWLHWLLTEHHIHFKIANITFRSLQSSQLAYRSTFNLACSSFHTFFLLGCQIPIALHPTSSHTHSFSVAATTIWNAFLYLSKYCSTIWG